MYVCMYVCMSKTHSLCLAFVGLPAINLFSSCSQTCVRVNSLRLLQKIIL